VKKIDKIERLMNFIIILKTRPGKTPCISFLSSHMDKSWHVPFPALSLLPQNLVPGDTGKNCGHEGMA